MGPWCAVGMFVEGINVKGLEGIQGILGTLRDLREG